MFTTPSKPTEEKEKIESAEEMKVPKPTNIFGASATFPTAGNSTFSQPLFGSKPVQKAAEEKKETKATGIFGASATFTTTSSATFS